MDAMHEPFELLDAFQRVSDAAFAVDHTMRVVYWNLGAERIFGIDEGAAIGRRCDEIVSGSETTGARLCQPDCRVMSCSRRGHAPETYDLIRHDALGKRQTLNVSIAVLRGRRRASTLTVHLVRDVTAQRLAEQRAGDVFTALRGTGTGTTLPEVTKREAEVLRLLALGASNASIGQTLGISTTTVRNHIEHLLSKMGVHSKLEAVVYAARAGLV